MIESYHCSSSFRIVIVNLILYCYSIRWFIPIPLKRRQFVNWEMNTIELDSPPQSKFYSVLSSLPRDRIERIDRIEEEDANHFVENFKSYCNRPIQEGVPRNLSLSYQSFNFNCLISLIQTP